MPPSLIDRLKYRRLRRRMAGPKLLRAFAEVHPQALFVEIGANDGSQHDHLRPLILESQWRGIMVEPVPYVFERLRRNYATVDRVRCENVAIGSEDGEMPFFHLGESSAEEGVPGWYDAIGSFSREAVLSHAEDIPGLEERLVETRVETITFDALLARNGAERVDLLVMDTEGHDWAIIRSLDFERHHPRLLVYEHFHLTPGERAACRGHLAERGYETLEEGLDTFALDTAPDDALTRCWRRVRPALPGVSKHEE